MTIAPKLREQIAADFDTILDWMIESTPRVFKPESPIEESLLLAIDYVARITREMELVRCPLDKLTPRHFTGTSVVLPQQQYGPWRVDFAVVIRCFSDFGNLDRTIIVECDGHEWHERTPEQASRDKARDRYFAERGMSVMRFTGREIWLDALGCAKQILNAVLNIRSDWDIETARVRDETEAKGGDK